MRDLERLAASGILHQRRGRGGPGIRVSPLFLAHAAGAARPGMGRSAVLAQALRDWRCPGAAEGLLAFMAEHDQWGPLAAIES